MVRAKNKKNLKQAVSGYTTRSKVVISTSLKWFLSIGVLGSLLTPPQISPEDNDYLPRAWFSFLFLSLGSLLTGSLIIVNNRQNNLLNLWWFCKSFLLLIIIHVGDQAITFTLMVDNKIFGLATILPLSTISLKGPCGMHYLAFSAIIRSFVASFETTMLFLGPMNINTLSLILNSLWKSFIWLIIMTCSTFLLWEPLSLGQEVW